MGDIFSKPEVTRLAPPQPVAPPPLETVGQAGETELRKKRSGRAETFLTGDLVPETEDKKKKKITLG